MNATERSETPPGLRRLWTRGREILREQGGSALFFTILGDLGYRRVLILERQLAEPSPRIEARVPLTFSRLGATQLDEYLLFHDSNSREHLEGRFARGDECFVARFEGRLVSASWISRHENFMKWLPYRYVLGPDEVYLYDAVTAPEFRGRQVAPALGAWVLDRLRDAGVARATLAIVPGNVANLRARAKTGFRVCGRIDVFSCFGMRWQRQREWGSKTASP